MTNISKKLIKQEVSNKISSSFTDIVAHLSSKNQISSFFFDFFTYSEKIMFQKRLTVILLILEEVPSTTIEELLKVSPATISKIAKRLDRGGYRNIVNIIEKKKESESFSRLLEKFIRAGLPPRGKGRWNWLDKHAGKQ